MSSKPIFYIFHGYGGENSLMPLVNYMQARQYNVLVIDDQKFPYKRHEMVTQLQNLKAQYTIVFFTSEHLWFDRYNYESIYWADPQMLAALELLDFLSPALSIFYPHDIESFMHKSEMRWASLFDLILLPYKNNDYYYLKQYNPNVEIVGWIKKMKDTILEESESFRPYQPVFFPSNIISFYQSLGAQGYADWFLKYIPASIPLKMPADDDGVLPILSRQGYTFLPPDKTIYDAMADHNLIIASGTSSIVYESALSGYPVISLLDGVFPDEVYLKQLKGVPGIYPVHPVELESYIQQLNSSQTRLKHGPNVLASFQFDKVLDLINSKLNA